VERRDPIDVVIKEEVPAKVVYRFDDLHDSHPHSFDDFLAWAPECAMGVIQTGRAELRRRRDTERAHRLEASLIHANFSTGQRLCQAKSRVDASSDQFSMACTGRAICIGN